MGYLRLNDYKTYIQGDHLRQLVQGDDDKRVIEENASVQAILQRLTGKYDLDQEFTETLPYSSTKTYTAGQRVTIEVGSNGFTTWVASTAYIVGDLVIYSGTGYKCITANSDPTFTLAKWTAIGTQYAIFYAVYPSTCTLNGQVNPATLANPYAPVFSYKNLYTKGDIVFWKGYTYVCAQDSTTVSHQQALQYESYNNIPYSNVFPDDPVNNANGQYWKTKTAYTVGAGSFTSSEFSKWTQGDNRNQTIKDAMVRITVFKLSPLIAPTNRPAYWLEDYRSILRELNEAARGEITLLLPMRQPRRGFRTYSGGNVKRKNNY